MHSTTNLRLDDAVPSKSISPFWVDPYVSDVLHDTGYSSDCPVHSLAQPPSVVNSGRFVSDLFSKLSFAKRNDCLRVLESDASILTNSSESAHRDLQAAVAKADSLLSHVTSSLREGVKKNNVSLCEFSVLHINLRGWRSHVDELAVYCSSFSVKPTLVAVNETFLNKSVDASLPGYCVVGRRDRDSSNINCFVDNLQSWGGIVSFISEEYKGAAVEVLESSTAERLWIVLHCDMGPLLLCIWYRPPAPSDISSISTLETEFVSLHKDVIGTVIIGDTNCHNARWLRFSAGNSVEGKALHRFCMDHGFDQYVKQTTRDRYLLDLVMSDMGDALACSVVAPIADHNGVLTKFRFSLDTFAGLPRTVWNFRSADWDGLIELLATASFDFIETDDIHTATQNFTDLILSSASRFISQREIPVERSVHPWITERCRILLQTKHDAVGTEGYKLACQKCSEALQQEFYEYVLGIKRRLADLPHGSKEFWKLSKKLLLGANKRTAIPALKYSILEDDDTYITHWAKTPLEKANLFSSTFRQKWVLPNAECNFYTNSSPARSLPRRGMLQLRSRSAFYYLSHLDPTSATGSDGLSTIL